MKSISSLGLLLLEKIMLTGHPCKLQRIIDLLVTRNSNVSTHRHSFKLHNRKEIKIEKLLEQVRYQWIP